MTDPAWLLRWLKTSAPAALIALCACAVAPPRAEVSRVAPDPFERLDAAEEHVRRVVGRLSREAGGIRLSVALLEEERPNAFADEDGRLSVTTGLLALVADEAELASVLAHEIGHVAAGHIQAMATAEAARAATTRIVAERTGSAEIARIFAAEARVGLLRYGRAQELEADRNGIALMIRAGYDPEAAIDLLRQLDRFDADEVEGNSADGRLLSTHPEMDTRLEAATRFIEALPRTGGERGAERHRRAVDGIPWGAPGGLRIIGATIYDPVTGSAWPRPEGLRTDSAFGRVAARSGRGAIAILDAVQSAPGAAAFDYVGRIWLGPLPPDALRALSLGGSPAAAAALVDIRSGDRLDLVAVERGPGRFVRLVVFSPARAGTAALGSMLRALDRIRDVRAAEEAYLAPMRVAFVQVPSGAGASGLIAGMASGLEDPERLFRLLNGLDPGEDPEPGSYVKLVVAEEEGISG